MLCKTGRLKRKRKVLIPKLRSLAFCSLCEKNSCLIVPPLFTVSTDHAVNTHTLCSADFEARQPTCPSFQKASQPKKRRRSPAISSPLRSCPSLSQWISGAELFLLLPRYIGRVDCSGLLLISMSGMRTDSCMLPQLIALRSHGSMQTIPGTECGVAGWGKGSALALALTVEVTGE